MKANLQYVKEKFEIFNKMIFDGQLKPLPIRIGHARTSLGGLTCEKKRNWLGMTSNTNFRMTISDYRDLPEEELDDVIIHEMIHYYIAYRQIKDTSPHGKVFTKMMRDINKHFNRHIAVSKRMPAPNSTIEVSGNNNTEKTIGRQRLVCVTELEDGRTGITIAAKTRIFKLWKDIPRLFHTKCTTWYWTRSTYFDKFPTSIKPKIYIVDKDEITRNLQGAIRLQNDGHRISPAPKD